MSRNCINVDYSFLAKLRYSEQTILPGPCASNPCGSESVCSYSSIPVDGKYYTCTGTCNFPVRSLSKMTASFKVCQAAFRNASVIHELIDPLKSQGLLTYRRKS